MVLQGLRTSNAVQKIILAGSEIAEARFMAASVKWNAISSGVVFAISTGINLAKWFNGSLTTQQFFQETMIQAGGALGSFGGGVLGSKLGLGIGSFFGPLGAVIGGAIGGIFGAVGGYIGGEELLDWLTNQMPCFQDDELTIKANAFVESMIALETPELAQLDNKEVQRCFRRKALQFHPDRLPLDISDEDKELAKLNWYTIEMAKDMLLQYCDNPAMMSLKLKEKVNELYRKYSKEVDLLKLRERLEAMKIVEISGEIELKKVK